MAAEGADAPRIHVVWGTGTGPTSVAAYDAALADANVHEYNLATLSSVVPPDAAVEAVGTAPDLGPRGGRLWVVQGRATVEGPGRATAALGWAVGPEGGVFYEAGGQLREDAAREAVVDGLDAARELRGRELPDGGVRTATLGVDRGAVGAAVVLAAYGDAKTLI